MAASCNPVVFGSGDPTLDTVLLEYVNSEDAFRCPSDHDGHWEKTGCSYFWNSLVNGQALGSMSFMGLTRNEAGIPLIADKENFHKSIGDEVNFAANSLQPQRNVESM